MSSLLIERSMLVVFCLFDSVLGEDDEDEHMDEVDEHAITVSFDRCEVLLLSLTLLLPSLLGK
jgi:hypothetical protein